MLAVCTSDRVTENYLIQAVRVRVSGLPWREKRTDGRHAAHCLRAWSTYINCRLHGLSSMPNWNVYVDVYQYLHMYQRIEATRCFFQNSNRLGIEAKQEIFV